MAITATGVLGDTSGNGSASASVTVTNIGDAVVLAAVSDTSGGGNVTVTSVSGGNANRWGRLGTVYASTTQAANMEIWLGTAIATGAGTITVTWSGSVTTIFIELATRTFTAGLGAGTAWLWDGTQQANTQGTSSTVAFGGLTAALGGELYVGFSWVASNSSAGATPGFTYGITSNGNAFVFDPNVAAGAIGGPTHPQSSAATFSTNAVMIRASDPFVSVPPTNRARLVRATTF